MRLLLDTQVFLWYLADSDRLTPSAKQQVAQAAEVFVSAASIWEAAIKAGLGKLQVDPRDLVQEIARNGFVELPVLASHAALVSALPQHHRDPFDRLLVAQAMAEPLHLLTSDSLLQRYPAPILLV